MTEGITAALLAVAVWATARSAQRGLLGLVTLGAILGAAAFVRPQSLLLAPLLGAIAGLAREHTARRPWRGPLFGAALATGVALLCLAPWTLRNGERMGRYALVSVNGGWNLLIGTEPAAQGTWAPLEVPDACKTVWDEAAKDTCFERAARERIAADPWTWLALVPKKLGATFDYAGAAPWYLHASNGAAFDDDAKVALGITETVYERLALLLALLGAARRAPAERGLAARLVALAGAPFALLPTAWPAYGALALAWLTRAPAPRTRGVAAAGLVVLGTLATHAVFFGAGRYALVVFPLVTGLGLAEALSPRLRVAAR